MHLIEQAFGMGSCDLYADVLQCPRDADAAALRRAYYRAALKYHPDKQQSNDDDDNATNQKFQAISLAYQILQDDDLRRDYDETGEIPSDDAVAAQEDEEPDSVNAWKQYFDQIFGKVTTSDIDAFTVKYKCSDEERRDVLQHFQAQKGSLTKMLEFVMLSEPRDAVRWVKDYLRPAMAAGGELENIPAKYKATMEKTLLTCQKKVEKENQEEADDDETESEEDQFESSQESSSKKAAASKSNKASPKKAKPSKAKRPKKKQKDDYTDLVAQIQNKNRGSNMLASLGARYGVSMDNDDDGDPLNDADFAKVQARLESNKQLKKRKQR